MFTVPDEDAMSLQVASGVSVGFFLSMGDEGAAPPTRPDAARFEPRRADSVLALTCRDVFDEVRRRLARKQYHWE